MDLRDYHLIAMHDLSERRGVWIRVRPDSAEIRAGREGDDDLLTFKVGEIITKEHLQKLRNIAETGAWETGAWVRWHEAITLFNAKKPLNHHQAKIIFDEFEQGEILQFGISLTCECCQEKLAFQPTVICKFCLQDAPSKTAHLHQEQYVGECCWDERLRSSE